ncbi:hypothetical protein RCL1_000258 [Eukaryota sp. TZLM3-RCL]
MGKPKKPAPKLKKIINPKDNRIVKTQQTSLRKAQTQEEEQVKLRHIPQVSSSFFFQHNASLGPPYHVICDTNFIHFSVKNKLTIDQALVDCLHAKAIPMVTDCIVAELEKLGQKYRVALRMAKSSMFQRLTCTHTGTYADDCICQRAAAHPIYIIGTCDRDLKRRIRKIPGTPIIYIHARRYTVERLPEAINAPHI